MSQGIHIKPLVWSQIDDLLTADVHFSVTSKCEINHHHGDRDLAISSTLPVSKIIKMSLLKKYYLFKTSPFAHSYLRKAEICTLCEI